MGDATGPQNLHKEGVDSTTTPPQHPTPNTQHPIPYTQ